MSLLWHPQSFTIITGMAEPHTAKEVHGLVDNLGLFGMHFVDMLHSYISITHLASGYRIHPEPGFPDLALAARFAERVAHLDFSKPKGMLEENRQFLVDNYNSFIIGAQLRESTRNK